MGFESVNDVTVIITVLVNIFTGYANPIPSINFRLHHLLMILGGVAGIINITIALVLIVQHLRNWTKPREQKQYVQKTNRFSALLTHGGQMYPHHLRTHFHDSGKSNAWEADSED